MLRSSRVSGGWLRRSLPSSSFICWRRRWKDRPRHLTSPQSSRRHLPCLCKMSAQTKSAPSFTLSTKNTQVKGLPQLILVSETLLCLFRESQETQRKCDLLFIISTISSAKKKKKNDFSLLITLSMKIKCFPKDLALAVARQARDLSDELHKPRRPIFLKP